LIEQASTNLCLSSEAFDTTATPWLLNNMTAAVQINTAVAPDGTTTADTITFNASIGNCIVCHNSGPNPIAPFPLETYSQVRDKAENGPLLTRIQLPAGDPSIMPKTGKMPQQLIDIIVAWADQGFLE